ncbi:MAG TPA: hypothetical protein VK578_16370 [Edaphobacter sp.]|nr:hypothetical protein [Edaphobacter sp.]
MIPHPNAVSPKAQRLYEFISNRLGDSGVTSIWLSADEAAQKAHLTGAELEAAQLELFRAGFVNIRHGDGQSKYQLLPPEKQIRREPTARIGQHRKPVVSRAVGKRTENYSGVGWSVRKEREKVYSSK